MPSCFLLPSLLFPYSLLPRPSASPLLFVSINLTFSSLLTAAVSHLPLISYTSFCVLSFPFTSSPIFFFRFYYSYSSSSSFISLLSSYFFFSSFSSFYFSFFSFLLLFPCSLSLSPHLTLLLLVMFLLLVFLLSYFFPLCCFIFFYSAQLPCFPLPLLFSSPCFSLSSTVFSQFGLTYLFIFFPVVFF